MRMFKQGGHRLFEKDPDTARIVSEMLVDLEAHGMDAVRRYSRKLDDWAPADFELSRKQIDETIARLDPQLIADTDFCQANVRRFAEAQLATLQPLEIETQPGVILGHRHIPVQSVGSYIPGGRYPMFGSAQMSIIPAQVAGVDNIYAFTPPVKGEGYFGATVNAMHKAGADRIFILGGVPAMAMMAFGMGVLEPVDIICGAGNKYVAEAKRQLYGRCGIDLLAGPTEILVIADDRAVPSLVACDLLGQAEHDPNSGLALVCFSEAFAQAAHAELERQLAVLPTRDIASQSWRDNGRDLYRSGSRRGHRDQRRLGARTSGDPCPGSRRLPDPPAKLRLAVHRRGNHCRLWRQDDRHQSHPAHQSFGTVHGRTVGRQIP